MAVKNCSIRGSVVWYVQLPAEHVDTQLLEDATRRGTPHSIHSVEPQLKDDRVCHTKQTVTLGVHGRGTIGVDMSGEGSCRCARAVVYIISHATGFSIITGPPRTAFEEPFHPFSMDTIQMLLTCDLLSRLDAFPLNLALRN